MVVELLAGCLQCLRPIVRIANLMLRSCYASSLPDCPFCFLRTKEESRLLRRFAATAPTAAAEPAKEEELRRAQVQSSRLVSRFRADHRSCFPSTTTDSFHRCHRYESVLYRYPRISWEETQQVLGPQQYQHSQSLSLRKYYRPNRIRFRRYLSRRLDSRMCNTRRGSIFLFSPETSGVPF